MAISAVPSEIGLGWTISAGEHVQFDSPHFMAADEPRLLRMSLHGSDRVLMVLDTSSQVLLPVSEWSSNVFQGLFGMRAFKPSQFGSD